MRSLRLGVALSARDRRALSLGGLTIVAAVLFARGVPTLRAWSDASVRSAREVVREAAHAEASVRSAAALRDTMQARSARLVALAPALLDGASLTAAGATLASLVSGAAATADAKLESAQLRTDSAARASSSGAPRTFARVSVRASLTADVRGLASFLLALERGPTLLVIDELAVTQPDPGSDGTRPEMLHVEVVVAGLALPRGEGEP